MMMMMKILNQGTQLTKAVFSGSLKEEKGEKKSVDTFLVILNTYCLNNRFFWNNSSLNKQPNWINSVPAR